MVVSRLLQQYKLTGDVTEIIGRRNTFQHLQSLVSLHLN